MYKSTDYEHQQLNFFHFNSSCGMALDKENEWIKKADRLPWKAWETLYAAMFHEKGRMARSCRMVFGSLIIQMRMGFSDRDLVKQIQENPYYQYFIGLEEFQHAPPFDPSLLVIWRKRLGLECVIKINDMLCGAMPTQMKSSKSFGLKVSGTLVATQICDATVAPQNIRYPQDTSLLNEARKKLESMIDYVCEQNSLEKPRVYRKVSEIDQKIISMYAKGMTTRQISDTLMDIYGFEASEGFISDVTDKLLPQIEEWQKRPLNDIYPVVFIDAIHYSVRDNNVIRKMAAYVILGINCEGRKDVLSIQIGENESSKYWLSVLNELKNRGVKDILILCADGLTGIKEAIAAAYPNTEYQRCLVHQVRNTLKYVADKDRKAFARDLKTIYNAPSEQEGRKALDEVTAAWEEKYPRAMKRWYDNWDAISPIFKFSNDVRTVIYTTNAIESLNSTYRRLNSQRSVFPSDTALLKALYLSTFEATKKWTMPIHNWGKVYGELAIMYDGRLPD